VTSIEERDTNHVGSNEGGQAVTLHGRVSVTLARAESAHSRSRFSHYLLEHWISVKGQIILNHSIGDLLGHLVFRHFVLWQILSCEFGAVDTGGEEVGVIASGHGDLLHAFDERSVDLIVVRDGGKMDHFCGVVGCLLVKEAEWSDVVRVVSGGSFSRGEKTFVREKAREQRGEGNGLFNFLDSPRLQWGCLVNRSVLDYAMLCLVGLLRAPPSSSFRPGWQLSQILAQKLNSSNHPVINPFLHSSFVMFHSIGLLPMYAAALLHFMFKVHYSLGFESCIGPPGRPQSCVILPAGSAK
jgi:hypothetical protein